MIILIRISQVLIFDISFEKDPCLNANESNVNLMIDVSVIKILVKYHLDNLVFSKLAF